jgi:3-oxoacyl-[acyl-carrier protein] reductase
LDLGLNGKRVLVGGGSRGIGLAIAEGFLREGAKVVLLARTAGPLADAAKRLAAAHGTERVIALAADCADANDWATVTDRINAAWGGLDVTVANAGDGRGSPDPLPDAALFAAGWRENFVTAELTARATLPLLEKSGGCLLFISSIAGLESIGAPTGYSVAKSAVVALSKQLARKLAPRVRVNCLAPGNVLFPGGSWDAKIQADRGRIERLINDTVPMKRFGTPEDIAEAALFLCSDRASFITGACLVADGGQTTGLH